MFLETYRSGFFTLDELWSFVISWTDSLMCMPEQNIKTLVHHTKCTFPQVVSPTQIQKNAFLILPEVQWILISSSELKTLRSNLVASFPRVLPYWITERSSCVLQDEEREVLCNPVGRDFGQVWQYSWGFQCSRWSVVSSNKKLGTHYFWQTGRYFLYLHICPYCLFIKLHCKVLNTWGNVHVLHRTDFYILKIYCNWSAAVNAAGHPHNSAIVFINHQGEAYKDKLSISKNDRLNAEDRVIIT